MLAGVVIWAVNNIEWFERKVGDETIALAPADHEPTGRLTVADRTPTRPAG